MRRALIAASFVGACLVPCAGAQTAAVKHATRTRLTGPALANDDYHVTYTVKVTGATSGRIELALSSLAHPAWKALARLRLSAGTASYTTRTITASGTYRMRALYLGDAAHLPSSATISWNVV